MRVTDRLVQQNQRKNDILKKQQPEDEETLTYRMRKMESVGLNQQSSVFQKKETSFHTQASVFDRMAVFHTKAERN